MAINGLGLMTSTYGIYLVHLSSKNSKIGFVLFGVGHLVMVSSLIIKDIIS